MGFRIKIPKPGGGHIKIKPPKIPKPKPPKIPEPKIPKPDLPDIDIEDLVEKAAAKALDELPDVGELVEKAAEAAVDALGDAAGEIARQASKHALKAAVAAAEALAPASIDLTLGPITLTVADPVEKLEALHDLARKGVPGTRRGVTHAIEVLAPTSIGISFSANVSLVVVNIDELGVGFAASWDAERVIDGLDKLLEVAGLD